MTVSPKPLRGWTVLVPRGGPWGHGVASDLRARGATPIVAPSINFAGTANAEELDAALERLTSGGYDWVSVTSATTVDVLAAHGVRIPDSTRVDFTPRRDNSAAGLLAEWREEIHPVRPQRILALRSDIAKTTLTDGLREAGHHVDSVVAYRTVGVQMAPEIVADVQAGRVDAILVSSGSVATQIATQFASVPPRTVIACIGPRTAADAEAVGLRVDLVARERTSASLIDTLEELAAHRALLASGA
jgi:uroporphyrinogen-III synthase